MNEDEAKLAKEMESANEANMMTLLQQEQQKRARFVEEELKHAEASSRVQDLYAECLERYKQTSAAERMLSAQAGQLLSALQREEARAAKLSSTVRKIRHTRKKMLNSIANPRWEVRHHYHMTCLEHALGHTQPHVLEVGQMVPGHLRLFTFARIGVLVHKSLILSLNRAKCARNNFSEKIKDVYRSLRLTRQDLKEQGKLLETIREKSHLLGKQTMPLMQGGKGQSSLMTQRQTDQGPLSIKMRYFKSLNMSPDNVEVQKLLQRWENDLTQDWKKVVTALETLEKQTLSKHKAKEELTVVESFRQGFAAGVGGLGGLATLPGPLESLKDDLDDMQRLSLNDEQEDQLEEQQGEALYDSVKETLDEDGQPIKSTVADQHAQNQISSIEKGKLPEVHIAPQTASASDKDLAQAKRAKELLEQQQQKQKATKQDKKAESSPWLFPGGKQKKLVSRGPSSRTRQNSTSNSHSALDSVELEPDDEYE